MSKPKKGKRFRYGLETVLRVRKIVETLEKEKLKQRERELDEERLKEQQIKKQQQDHLNYVRELLTDELPQLNTIQMNEHHVKIMGERVKKQQQEVKKSEKRRDDQRKEVIKRSRDKKIIEKDKIKTRASWKKMMDKLDSQFLDELASIKFASNMLKKEEDEQNPRSSSE